MTEAELITKQLNEIGENFNKKLDPVNDFIGEQKEWNKVNQEAIDNLLSETKAGNRTDPAKNKSFGEAFKDAVREKFTKDKSEFDNFTKDRAAKIAFEVKSVGTMTLANNLTGDSWQTYSQNQGIIPAQKVNFRDLVPGFISATGQYVHYYETEGEGSVGEQITEGASKSQIDFDLTEVKTVTKYIAGFTRFSKQLAKSLPFYENTLPRMLLREFFKQENNQFKNVLAGGATGYTTTSETDDAKQLIDVLTGRADANFDNSFIICKNAQVGVLLKLLYTNGYYSGSGSVVGTPNGQVFIAGVPVIGASWMTAGKVAIIDRDFIERVEAESLRVELSYDDADNFTKNLVTARVECMEELNLIRTDAHSYFTI